MIAPHSRLIKDSHGIVRHHVAPNGTVHTGHPLLCDHAKCRAWGETLPIETQEPSHAQ